MLKPLVKPNYKINVWIQMKLLERVAVHILPFIEQLNVTIIKIIVDCLFKAEFSCDS